MVLESLEKKGGDSRVFMIEGNSIILEAGKRIKVPDGFKYDKKKFKKITKMPSRTYNIEIRDGVKIRGSIIRT